MIISNEDPRASDLPGYVPPPCYAVQHRTSKRYLGLPGGVPSRASDLQEVQTVEEAYWWRTKREANLYRLDLEPFHDAWECVPVPKTEGLGR